MLWEAMVAEMRATAADLAARSVFAAPKEPVHDTRALLDRALGAPQATPQRRTPRAGLATAAADGAVEWG